MAYQTSGNSDTAYAQNINAGIDMDNYLQALQGGFVPLSTEAMPSIDASAAIFANAPAGTVAAEVTVQTQDMIVRWNVEGGTTAATTSAGGGQTYAKSNTYWFPYGRNVLKAARAIAAASGTVGTITYWGVK